MYLENGEVYSWGDGKYGNLGVGSGESKWEPNLVNFQEEKETNKIGVFCGSHHSIVLTGFFI